MKTFIGCLFALGMAFPASLSSQYVQGKFGAGLRGGANVWMNDMNDRRVGLGAEAFVRYGLSGYVSPGIVANMEILRAGQFPLDPPDYVIDYLKVTAFSFAAQAWLYLAPGNNFSPYVYAGVGVTFYARELASGALYPTEEFGKTSSHYIPFGIGFESFVSKNTSISLDVGYRGFNQHTDYIETGSSDGFVTMKLGITLFFGSNEDDDDDGDGLINRREAGPGLDPNNPDSDGDGLRDGDEVLKYKTNPQKADTDGDRLNDSDEIRRYGTEPLRPDSDKDGLNDGDEVLVYNTDPLKLDTDKDGLSDGEEVATYQTDPLKNDTDGDGLADANELYGFKTNPLAADTDGGGVNDGTEVKGRTNPLKGEDDIPGGKRGSRTISSPFSDIVDGIRFAQSSSVFTPESEYFLMQLRDTLMNNIQLQIEIQGYTDNRGPLAKNYRLSSRRATAVKQWLEEHGIKGTRVRAKGFGPENPIAPNTTEEGRERNRRIEIVVK